LLAVFGVHRYENRQSGARFVGNQEALKMIRHVAAAVVVLGLASSTLYAQNVVFTVNAASASVHAGPSTATPVIGSARKGAVLEVTRELGSWVRVPWPTAKDGVGYLHVSAGSIGRGVQSQSAGLTPPRGGSPVIAPTSAGVQRARPVVPSSTPVYISQDTHKIGLGGRMGGVQFGMAASARAWRTSRLGIQLDLAHYSLTNVAGSGRMTSTQFEPSVLFALNDRVSDAYWLRPYVGAGANLGRHTLSGDALELSGTQSEDRFGLQAFGGGEVTFAAIPRFAVSADVSYRWSRMPFAGHDFNGVGVAVSGHWYIR
jgi:uncharacterized protein YraI